MNDILLSTEELIKIVNQALEVYHNTPIEEYPEARGIDKLDSLLPPNSRYMQQAYDWYMQVIDSLTA